MDYFICPNCKNKTLAQIYEDGDLFVCNDCNEEFTASETYNGGLKFVKNVAEVTEESIEICESEKYKGYTIKPIDNKFKIFTPDEVEDWETDTIEDAKSWIDNKSSKNAEEEIAKLFPKARKLSYSLIDKYITYDGQKKLDNDNTFLVKFKTKRDRQQGERLAKSNGFIVVERTDDDYNMSTKFPFWTFFSINKNEDKWMNESLSRKHRLNEDEDDDFIYEYEPYNDNEDETEFNYSGEYFDELEDAIAYCEENPQYNAITMYIYDKLPDGSKDELPSSSELVWLNGEDVFESLKHELNKIKESLEMPSVGPIKKLMFGKYRVYLEAQAETNKFAIVGYNSMVAISKKIYNSLESAEKAYDKIANSLNKLKQGYKNYIDAINANSEKAGNIVMKIGNDLNESKKPQKIDYNLDGKSDVLDTDFDDDIDFNVDESIETEYGPYWYFTTHGVQPGSVPKDIQVITLIDTTNGTYFLSDKLITTRELNEFEIKEQKPEESLITKEVQYDIDKYLKNSHNNVVSESPNIAKKHIIKEAKSDSKYYSEFDPIRAWIGNLGKYNEGELKGGWVSFPIDEDDLDEFLKDVVGINEVYEEYGIFDWESDFMEYPGEYANLDNINEIAETIDSMSSYDKDILSAAIEIWGNDIDIADFDAGDYTLMSGVEDVFDLGSEFITEVYGGIEELSTDTLVRYVDIDDWIDDVRAYDSGSIRDDFEYENGYESEDDYEESEFEEYLDNYLEALADEAYSNPAEFLGREQLESRFDYSAFGRDLGYDFDGGFTNYGYIYRN